jgi:hypothetical protein
VGNEFTKKMCHITPCKTINAPTNIVTPMIIVLTPRISHKFFPKYKGATLTKIMQIDEMSLTIENLFRGKVTAGLSNRNIEANSNPRKLIGKLKVTSIQNAIIPSKPCTLRHPIYTASGWSWL